MAFRAVFAVRVFTFVAILSFLVFMLEVSAGSKKAGTLTITDGRRIKGDTELWRNNTKVTKRPGTQQNKVCYPSKSSVRVNITMYEVRDLMPPGRKGYARLHSGGVNKTSTICFLLTSYPSQAYNFTITLWGFRS